MDIGSLPNHITTDELATLLRQDVEHTRNLARKHKDVLQPFKLGKHNCFTRENVEIFYHLLTTGKLNENS